MRTASGFGLRKIFQVSEAITFISLRKMGKSIVVAAVLGRVVLIGHVECFRSAGNLAFRTIGNGRLCPQLQLRRSVGVFQNLKSQVRLILLKYL